MTKFTKEQPNCAPGYYACGYMAPRLAGELGCDEKLASRLIKNDQLLQRLHNMYLSTTLNINGTTIAAQSNMVELKMVLYDTLMFIRELNIGK